MITGILMVVLTLTGTLSMSENQDQVRSAINAVALKATEISDRIPGINVIFFIACMLFIFWLVKLLRKEKDSCCSNEETL